MTPPLPFWCETPPAAQDQEQTLSFSGVAASGQFQLQFQLNPLAPVLTTGLLAWNSSAANIATALNALYAPADIGGSGSISSQSVVLDMGVESETNLILKLVPVNVTLKTAGAADVVITPSVSQSGLLPSVVPVDTSHSNNGFNFMEFPPFNMFNQWMQSVSYWVRQAVNGGNWEGGPSAGGFFCKLTIAGFPSVATIANGTRVFFSAGAANGGGLIAATINTVSYGDIFDPQGYTYEGGEFQSGEFVTLEWQQGGFFAVIGRESGDAPNYFGVDSGAANAYVVKQMSVPINPRPISMKGTRLTFYPIHNNTGASTLTFNALSTVFNIKTLAGANPNSGALVANVLADLLWDGTNLVLLNPQA